jgi:SAM-dependent methyltransferase
LFQPKEADMAGDNSEQIRDWNGPLGQRWVEDQTTLDRLTAPFGLAALTAVAASHGERAIDVGCGCGATSIALAEAVGNGGSVLGVDVSRPMLDIARRRGANLPQLRFEEADASNASLPQDQDLLYSRFGVMFFAAPVPAFAHLRRTLKESGRLAFVCWQGPKENLWASVPVQAARTALGVTPPPADPHAPGPFAFADGDRVRMILLEANFRDADVEPFDAPMSMGETIRAAAESAARIGPVSRLAREAGPDALPRIIDAVEAALTPLAARDGSVALPGRAWIVTAQAG